MPIYNDARCLPHALQSLSKQTFDSKRIFVVLVDGNSTDTSAPIARAWLERAPFDGVLLSNVQRAIPISLNSGLRYASPNDVVMRMDSHSVWGPDYVAQAVTALEQTPQNVACVGCAAYPMTGKDFNQRVVEALYTNHMGLGSDASPAESARPVDSVYLGAWRAHVLLTLGGYNEAMRASEDAELAARARRRGYRILRVLLPCRFIVKRGILGTIAQWARYGFWRAKTLQRHAHCVRLRHVACPLAIVAMTALLLSPLRALLAALFVLYAGFVILKRSRNEPWTVTLTTIAFFPLVQLGYGMGIFAGLVSRRVRARTNAEPLLVRVA